MNESDAGPIRLPAPHAGCGRPEDEVLPATGWRIYYSRLVNGPVTEDVNAIPDGPPTPKELLIAQQIESIWDGGKAIR